MALQLVSDDDTELEEQKATDKQIELFKKLYQLEEINKILSLNKIDKVENMPKSLVSQLISNKYEKK